MLASYSSVGRINLQQFLCLLMLFKFCYLGNPIEGKQVDVKKEIKEAKAIMEEIGNIDGDSTKSSPGDTAIKSQKAGLEPAVPKSQEKPKAKPVQVSQTKKSQQSADSKLTENSKPDTKQQVPEIATVQPPTPTQQVNSSTAVTSNNLLDTISVNSKISAITEESETGADFYEQLMAKYGIELSDDSDDDY